MEQSQLSLSSNSSFASNVAQYYDLRIYLKKFSPGNCRVSNEAALFLRKVCLSLILKTGIVAKCFEKSHPAEDKGENVNDINF